MTNWAEQPGIWLSAGLIIGVAADIIGRSFIGWLRRPILKYPKDSELDIWPVKSRMEVYPPGITDTTNVIPDIVHGTVWRLKIGNRGKRAALNVQGTVKLRRPASEDSHEQRICWYEQGNRSSITLNAEDHSYLDLYGVPEDKRYKGTIVIPMEHGWDCGLRPTKIKGNDIWQLRVSGANCAPLMVRFDIARDSSRGLANVEVVPSYHPEAKEEGSVDLLRSRAKSLAKDFLGLTIGLSSISVIGYGETTVGFILASICAIVSAGILALVACFWQYGTQLLRRPVEWVSNKLTFDTIPPFLGLITLGVALIQREVPSFGIAVVFLAYIVLFLPGYYRIFRGLARILCWSASNSIGLLRWLIRTVTSILPTVFWKSRIALERYFRGKDSSND